MDITPKYSTIRLANKGGEFQVVTGNQTIKTITGKTHITVKSPWHYTQYKNVFVSDDETAVVSLSLSNAREDFLKIQKQKKIGFYSSITATGVTAISYFFRSIIYSKYINAVNVQDANDFRKQTEFFNTITTVSCVLSACTWGYTFNIYLADNTLKKRINYHRSDNLKTIELHINE